MFVAAVAADVAADMRHSWVPQRGKDLRRRPTIQQRHADQPVFVRLEIHRDHPFVPFQIFDVRQVLRFVPVASREGPKIVQVTFHEIKLPLEKGHVEDIMI